jgi:hypothetical protein
MSLLFGYVEYRKRNDKDENNHCSPHIPCTMQFLKVGFDGFNFFAYYSFF